MAATPATLIPLTNLASELPFSPTGTRPTYRALYLRALDGRLPGAHQVEGRWFVRRSDLPAIAAAFGLTDAATSSYAAA